MKTHKIIKTVIASGLLVASYNSAIAQDTNPGGTVTTQIATSIVEPPNYSDSQLIGVGCSPNVWKQMVYDYKSRAAANIAYRTQIQVANQGRGAASPELIGQCFDSAAQTINNVARTYDFIKKLLSGNFDTGKLQDYAQKVAANAACSQMNSYISQSGLTTTINGGVNTVNSGIGGVLYGGNTIGGVNVGSIDNVLNNGGYYNGSNSTVPYVNGSGVASGVINGVNNIGNSNTSGSGITGYISNLNPFK